MCRSGSEASSSAVPQLHDQRAAAWQARRAAAQSGSTQAAARLPQRAPAGPRQVVREVWAKNFEAEFQALINAVASAKGGAVIGLDTEFPGFYCQEPRSSTHDKQYEALRKSVDMMQPIQFGISVANTEGKGIGTWSFNMHFDPRIHLHREASLTFLQAAGVNFQRHATQGLDAKLFGERLAGSKLVGVHEDTPQWITFSGNYDFGYILKILTQQPLPKTPHGFDLTLNTFCPRRFDLQERMPLGSLEDHVCMFGVQRTGVAHTAGSDALATLELYFISAAARLQTRSLQPPGLAPPEELEQPAVLEPPPGLEPPLEPDANQQVGSRASGQQQDQSQVSWVATARLAMLSERVGVDVDCVAPSSQWGAIAREAAIQASASSS